MYIIIIICTKFTFFFFHIETIIKRNHLNQRNKHIIMESVQFAAPVDNHNKEWNKKKNYGPAVLFTVLLLGTAFLAGKSYGRNSNDPTSSVSPIASLSVPVRLACIDIYFVALVCCSIIVYYSSSDPLLYVDNSVSWYVLVLHRMTEYFFPSSFSLFFLIIS